MSTQAQDVFNRAIALSDANSGFVSLPANEILARLNYAQGILFTKLAQDNRTYYLTSKALVSTAGASGRVVDLSTLVPPLERAIIIFLPNGQLLNVVDVQDQAAELAPRAFPVGTQLVEVNNEWSGTPGVVTLTVWYVFRPALLLLNNDLTQLMTIPDQFASYFDYDVALYFAQKDTGRVQADPAELDRLGAAKSAAYENILQYLDHFNGVASRRFIYSVPTTEEKA